MVATTETMSNSMAKKDKVSKPTKTAKNLVSATEKVADGPHYDYLARLVQPAYQKPD